MRPDVSYQDLRDSTGNSGNVEENLSLYWHPTVYSYDSDTGIYTKDDIFYSSSYYIWTTGDATAFPDGFKVCPVSIFCFISFHGFQVLAFVYLQNSIISIPTISLYNVQCIKYGIQYLLPTIHHQPSIIISLSQMKATSFNNRKARASAECVSPGDCERSDCESDSNFFPAESCAELEVSMAFPTCWDGVNKESRDQSHVSYDVSRNGRFDGRCPPTHPVKLPEIQFFFRIINYSGGKHLFADGTEYYHADYFSGWDSVELQNVLVSVYDIMIL